MIFNMMGSLVKKDAEWIPLTNGVQTMAPPPANWTSYSFILDRQPSIVVLKTHYGGADVYNIIDWFGSFGFGTVNENCFRNASITSAKTINDLPSGSKIAPKVTTPVSATPNEMDYYTVEITYPAIVTVEIQGGDCFYCPIYDSE